MNLMVINTPKTLILFSLCGLLIIGCTIKEDREKAALASALEEGAQSTIRNDTIFLDFRFGMTEKEAVAHAKKLVKEKKLSLNEKNKFKYTFSFDDDYPPSVKASFNYEFYKDKLYKFSIYTDKGDLMTNKNTCLILTILYIKKYGVSYRTKSPIGELDNQTWIDANREIQIVQGIGDTRIYYIDLIAEKEKEMFEKSVMSKQAETTKDDI